MAVLEAGFDDATAVLMLLERYRKRPWTTKGIEWLNRGDPPAGTGDSNLSEQGIGCTPDWRPIDRQQQQVKK